MISCCDLVEEAKLFTMSVRLQNSSSSLKRLLEEKRADEKDKETLKWAGNLVGQVDWGSSAYGRGNFDCVLATRVRPFFYDAFIKLRFPVTRDFLDRFYITLNSSGEKVQLNLKELGIAQQLMHKMSDRIITYLYARRGQL